jgi:hypothetical protein
LPGIGALQGKKAFVFHNKTDSIAPIPELKHLNIPFAGLTKRKEFFHCLGTQTLIIYTRFFQVDKITDYLNNVNRGKDLIVVEGFIM